MSREMWPEQRPECRFLVDCMLGKLAKWLRILGYDTTYYSLIADHELIRIAWNEKRILLTRDVRLTQRREVTRYLLIKSDDYREQLRQVVWHYRLDASSYLFTRCLQCNSPLQDIEKARVRPWVPPYVFQTQELFRICPSCQQIYWAGTHKTKMLHRLAKILASHPLSSKEGE
ncbi:MAG: hypothetical protein D6736_03610 [Nitrospinota bacterium]|nr:MAG: hypothetical protein D6736_03610 [Nitrospinota bacterium]